MSQAIFAKLTVVEDNFFTCLTMIRTEQETQLYG